MQRYTTLGIHLMGPKGDFPPSVKADQTVEVVLAVEVVQLIQGCITDVETEWNDTCAGYKNPVECAECRSFERVLWILRERLEKELS